MLFRSQSMNYVIIMIMSTSGKSLFYFKEIDFGFIIGKKENLDFEALKKLGQVEELTLEEIFNFLRLFSLAY